MVTTRVSDERNEWTSRPLLAVYSAIVIDAIDIKVRDGQVANRGFCYRSGLDGTPGCAGHLGRHRRTSRVGKVLGERP